MERLVLLTWLAVKGLPMSPSLINRPGGLLDF